VSDDQLYDRRAPSIVAVVLLRRFKESYTHSHRVLHHDMLNSCFGRVLVRSLSAHLMQVKLLLFTFYLNSRLHAVSVGKPSERM